MATALKGVNASASGLVVAAALILGQSYATSLPEQVLAMLCFSGITFFGVHQALTVLPNPNPDPNPNPNPSPNPGPEPNPDPSPNPSQALTVLLGSLLAVPIFWATDTFLSA